MKHYAKQGERYILIPFPERMDEECEDIEVEVSDDLVIDSDEDAEKCGKLLREYITKLIEDNGNVIDK